MAYDTAAENILDNNVLLEEQREKINNLITKFFTHLDSELVWDATLHNHAEIDNLLNTIESVTSYIDITGAEDGDYLKYSDIDNKFKPTDSTSSPHKLFSSQHTDINLINNPKYGDVLIFDGTKFVPGQFGNWGSDIDYIKILGIKETALPVGTGDLIGVNDLTYDTNYTTKSGTITYNIGGFVGEALNTDAIRGIFIHARVQMDANVSARDSALYVTYPDGTERTLLSTDNQDGQGRTSNWIEASVFVPIKKNQESFTIRVNTNNSGSGERAQYTLTDLLVTETIELNPDFDKRYLTIGIRDNTSNAGYVGYDTPNESLDFGWSSDNENEVNTFGDLFPIVIPNDVTKTVITFKNGNYTNSGNFGNSETPWDNGELTIDWNNKKITGIYIAVHDDSDGFVGYIDENSIFGEFFFTKQLSNSNVIPSIMITGREIKKLPVYKLNSGGYNYGGVNKFTYAITNYRTVASKSNTNSTSYLINNNGMPGVIKFQEYMRGRCSSIPDLDSIAYINKFNEVRYAGYGRNYKCGVGQYRHSPGPVIPLPITASDEIPIKVINTVYHLAVITDKSNLYFSGYNGYNHYSLENTDARVDNDITHLSKSTVEDVKKVLMSSVYSTGTVYMLTNSGDLYAAGQNSNGQHGNGTTNNIGNASSIGGAIKTLTCNPDNTTHQDGVLPSGVKVIDIVDSGASADTIIALLSDGTLKSCGYNGHGQLGIGSSAISYSTTWQTINLQNVVEIQECGLTGSFYALLNNGDLYSWGYNGYGQLGIGNTANTYSPELIVNNVSKFWAGDRWGTLFFLLNDPDNNGNSLFACGYNGNRQLGINLSSTSYPNPQPVIGINGEKVIELITESNSRYGGNTFAITTNGIYACGANSYCHLGVQQMSGSVKQFMPVITKLGKSYPILPVSNDYPTFAFYASTTVVLIDANYAAHGCGDNDYQYLDDYWDYYTNTFTRTNKFY